MWQQQDYHHHQQKQNQQQQNNNNNNNEKNNNITSGYQKHLVLLNAGLFIFQSQQPRKMNSIILPKKLTEGHIGFTFDAGALIILKMVVLFMYIIF